MEKQIIVLVGPPAAGKSTWIEKEYQGECWVASSDYWLEQFAAVKGTTYDDAFKLHASLADKEAWRSFDKYVEAGYSPIIFDRTHMSVRSRRRIFERLKNFHKGHNYVVDCIVFPKPEDTEWQRRLNSRPGKTLSENVLDHMLSAFQMPTVDEGFRFIRVMEPAISG